MLAIVADLGMTRVPADIMLRNSVLALSYWKCSTDPETSDVQVTTDNVGLEPVLSHGTDQIPGHLVVTSQSETGDDGVPGDHVGAKAVAARLQRSHLSRALLLGVDFSLADLTDTDLSGANLSGAKFADCRLFGAKMVGANLCGADLSTVIGLSPLQVAHISTDRSTKFPEYLKGVPLEAGRRA